MRTTITPCIRVLVVKAYYEYHIMKFDDIIKFLQSFKIELSKNSVKNILNDYMNNRLDHCFRLKKYTFCQDNDEIVIKRYFDGIPRKLQPLLIYENKLTNY